MAQSRDPMTVNKFKSHTDAKRSALHNAYIERIWKEKTPYEIGPVDERRQKDLQDAESKIASLIKKYGCSDETVLVRTIKNRLNNLRLKETTILKVSHQHSLQKLPTFKCRTTVRKSRKRKVICTFQSSYSSSSRISLPLTKTLAPSPSPGNMSLPLTPPPSVDVSLPLTPPPSIDVSLLLTPPPSVDVSLPLTPPSSVKKAATKCSYEPGFRKLKRCLL